MRKTAIGTSILATAAIAAIAATAGGSSGQRATASADRRPNVVVIMTDDQTLENMNALPNVRRLIGRRGTTFDRSFASYPLCCPSRATYLTGQYSHNNGVISNGSPTGGFYKLNSSNTLPVWMARAKYNTAHIGKYLNEYGNRNPRQVPGGWREWYGSVDPSTYQFYDYTLNENGRLHRYGSSSRDYQADVYTRIATRYIRRKARSRRPFFLSVAYLAPHAGGPTGPGQRCRGGPQPAPRHSGRFEGTAAPAPPSFGEPDVSDKPAAIRRLPAFRRSESITRHHRCRRESLLAVDEGVRAIMRQLDRSRELRNTIVIFTSDNGWFNGEHRIGSGKIRVYEESVRVPLLIRGPGIPRNRHVGGVVANIDLARTIARAGRARARRTLDGVSLVSAARRPSSLRNRAILLENGPNPRAFTRYAAVRTERYVWVEYVTGERELYDLERDPYQLQSRHADPAYAGVRAELVRRLAALRSCRGSSCRR